MNLYESIKENNKEKPKRKYNILNEGASPRTVKSMPGKKPLKKIVKGSALGGTTVNESAEGVQAFWDKVDAGEIKVGDTIPTDGAGDVEILDLDKGADYALIKRSAGYQPYVAAWAPEFNGNALVWGQGHYFTDEADAREYFNEKALKECDNKKVGKSKKAIKEANEKEIYIPGFRGTQDVINSYKKLGKNATVEDIFNDLVNNDPDIYKSYSRSKRDGDDPREFKETIKKILDKLNESCGKKKRPTLKESNPAKYLGVKVNLTEKVNQDNVDINAKIREALRSKPAARKYEKEFNDAGITVDYSPREGVKLVGKNGRELSADRKNIYGPTKPGFKGTHDTSGYGNNVKEYKRDIQNYNERIAKKQAELDNPLDRDDIIRKYPDNTTEEALAKYEKNRASIKDDIEHDKRWRRNAEEYIRDVHDKRQMEHNRELDNPQYSASDRAISNNAVALDKIDYKGYLDSKDNNENKDFVNRAAWAGGPNRRTKGQRVRDKLKSLKRDVNDTIPWGAKTMVRDMAINDDYIKNQKQALKDEYTRKEKELVAELKNRKKKANEDFKRYDSRYKENVKNLEQFRREHNIKPKDSKDFSSYVNDMAKFNY